VSATEQAFDYVVVGAGSADCVLANRLSADGGASVLLVEAGPAGDKLESRVPVAFSKLFKSCRDWDYLTDPSDQVLGRRLYWPRGRMMGGSSALNAMIYMRGDLADYEEDWGSVGGKPLTAGRALGYFLRSEDNERGRSVWHATGGELIVRDQRSPSLLSEAFVASAVEAGVLSNPDFNGPCQQGAGLYQVNQFRGRRASAYDCFLKRALHRPNLTVMTGAEISQVVFSGSRAVGVRTAGPKVIRADREVILSAGAVGSPHLLMRSGVGSAADLEMAGVAVVLDQPEVGAGLQDHPAVPLSVTGTYPSLAEAESAGQIMRYVLLRRGMLSSNVAEAGAFVNPGAKGRPTIQHHFVPGLVVEHGLTPPPSNGFTLLVTLVEVASRGRIRLDPADPWAKPRIEAGYLNEPADLRNLIEGVRNGIEILSRSPIAKLAGRPQQWPESDLATFVRQTLETLYHPVGTCALGTVLDDRFRVQGLDGLRVVDASSMPVIPRGNTNAPVIMLAEMAAELIGSSA
jgi:choline dehydrogenase